MAYRVTFQRAQRAAIVLVGVAVGIAIAIGCTEQALLRARPAVTAVETGLTVAGQPAAAGAVEAGFRAWEAALYLGGAITAAWGARKGVRAIRRRGAAKAGAPHGTQR